MVHWFSSCATGVVERRPQITCMLDMNHDSSSNPQKRPPPTITLHDLSRSFTLAKFRHLSYIEHLPVYSSKAISSDDWWESPNSGVFYLPDKTHLTTVQRVKINTVRNIGYLKSIYPIKLAPNISHCCLKCSHEFWLIAWRFLTFCPWNSVINRFRCSPCLLCHGPHCSGHATVQ